MKPSRRLLQRRQDVRRAERDLLSVLVAEGSLSSDWLEKAHPRRRIALPPMGSEPRTSDAAETIRRGTGSRSKFVRAASHSAGSSVGAHVRRYPRRTARRRSIELPGRMRRGNCSGKGASARRRYRSETATQRRN